MYNDIKHVFSYKFKHEQGVQHCQGHFWIQHNHSYRLCISIVFFDWKFNHVGHWIIPTLVNKINHLQGEVARSIMNYSSNLTCYVLIDIHGMMSYNVAKLYFKKTFWNIFWSNCQQCKISHGFTTQPTNYKIK